MKLPVGDELKKVEEVFRRSGYPGAVGSTDCTHFKWRGPFSEARINTGKEGYQTVAVEATCDHTGELAPGSLRLAVVFFRCLPWYLIFSPCAVLPKIYSVHRDVGPPRPRCLLLSPFSVLPKTFFVHQDVNRGSLRGSVFSIGSGANVTCVLLFLWMRRRVYPAL